MSIGWYRLHPILRMGIASFRLRAIALFLALPYRRWTGLNFLAHAYAIGVLYRFGETFAYKHLVAAFAS